MMTSAAPAAQKPLPMTEPRRYGLTTIVRGRLQAPAKVFAYGVDGVGKTTFAASAPDVLFIDAEGSTDELDVARWPRPEDRGAITWADVLALVRAMGSDAVGHKSLAVDTVDWLEPLIHKHICTREAVASIEDVGGGYGKGFNAAVDEWRLFLAALEQLQVKQRMNVILLGHSQLTMFKNPEGEDFERYSVKMHGKSAGLLREWVKGVYFCNFQTFADVDKKKRVRGISTGARLMYTVRTAAYDAKDRYGLPENIPLSWAEFEKARAAAAPADPALLLVEIERKAKELGGALETTAREYLGKAGQDARKLAQVNDWLNAKIGEKAEREAATTPPKTAAEPAAQV